MQDSVDCELSSLSLESWDKGRHEAQKRCFCISKILIFPLVQWCLDRKFSAPERLLSIDLRNDKWSMQATCKGSRTILSGCGFLWTVTAQWSQALIPEPPKGQTPRWCLFLEGGCTGSCSSAPKRSGKQNLEGESLEISLKMASSA